MIDDARYADDFEDDDEQQVADERFAIIRAAVTIRHQAIDKASALRMVLNRAHDDAIAAAVGLLTVDPDDSKAVRDLQWQVGRYDAMCSYINEVLAAGDEAADALTAEQAERLSEVAGNMLDSEQVEIDD